LILKQIFYFSALNSFINNSFNNVDLSKPQAFIVYITFDKEMNLDPMNSGVVQVEHAYEIKYAKSREERIGISTANALGQLSRTAIAPRKDGYFYTYVTNRSAGKVHFDNMVIKRWAPQVRVTYDYYPYGLTWEDPRLPGSPESVHDHCYQDKEFQWAEFTTGHGLALHDFHVTKRLVAAQRRLSDSSPAAQRCGARMYDGATGRWLVPDPAAQFANPYLAMGNNPVMGVDPDGRFAVTAILVGAAIGAGLGAMQATVQQQSGADMWRTIGIGALTGAIGGLSGAYPLVNPGVGFINGFLAGAVNGAATGMVTGGVSAALMKQDVVSGMTKGALMGGLSGGITGGIHGVKAVNKLNKSEGCYDDWYYRRSDGALVKHDLTSTNSPDVCQKGAMNCVGAGIESIDASLGGDVRQDAIRAHFGGDPKIDPLPFEEALDYYASLKGYSTEYGDYSRTIGSFDSNYNSFDNEIASIPSRVRAGQKVAVNFRSKAGGEVGHTMTLKSVSLKTVIRQNNSFRAHYRFTMMNPAGGYTSYPSYSDFMNAHSIGFVIP
jgi:RHS repeat-associated protein